MPTTETLADYQRLAEALRACDIVLDLDHAALVEASDTVTDREVRLIATVFKKFGPVLRLSIDRAAGWQPGSTAAVLNGGGAIPIIPDGEER
jgi:hypothetical protein